MFRYVFIYVLILIKVVSGQSSNYLQVPKVEDVRVYEDIKETYRLPNNTRPESYQINLRTWIHEENFTFKGNVAITFVVTEASSSIVLHHRQLTIENIVLRSLDEAVLPTTYEYDPIHEFLIVNVAPSQLTAESKYILEIEYAGILRTDEGGFYRSSYLNDNGNRIWLATTQFEPTDARHGFPCFDEPALKARFSISITHDSSYSAISNMPVNGQDMNDDGSVTTYFEETPPTSTYLIAFIVSDFEFLENSNDGRFPHRTYARPNAIQQTEFALQIGVGMLDTLIDYIGIDYPLPKMDQAAIPDFAAGAMENWGLVTYREPAFFYNESESTISVQAGIVGIIGHEFAHMWFGNLVSPKWWTYLWLNEGFATLFGNIGVYLLYPGWSNEEYFVATTRYGTLRSDALAASHPMTHYIETPAAVDAMFNNIAYGKSALVLRMFSEAVTGETFAKGVRFYLEARAFSDATEEDLFEGLQRAVIEDSRIIPANTSIEILMSTWTRQAGFPIIEAIRDYNETGNVVFRQRRFLSENSSMQQNVTYWVPVFVGLPTDESPEYVHRPIQWFSNIEETLRIPGMTNDYWFIANKFNYGFYRVLYDRQNYRLITDALINYNFHQFSVIDRASIIDDLYVFSESDIISYDVFFDLIQYLRYEHYYEPWYYTTQALTSIVRRYDGAENNEILRDFIRSLLEFYYEFTGIEEEEDEHRLKKYSRNIAISWACNMGSLSCRRDANLALRTILLENGEFHQNVRDVLYCAALRDGDRFDYEAVWSRLSASNNQPYRNMLINALGCTSSTLLLEEFLYSSLNSTNANGIIYRPGEQLRIFNAVYQSGSQGLVLAINFLHTHLTEAAETFGRINIVNIVIGMAERISLYSTREQFIRLLFTARNENYISIDVVEQLLDIMKTNELWFFKHENIISSWLRQNPVQ